MTKAERYRRCEEAYQVELARSASYLASCMTAESMSRCVDEVLRALVRDRGADDLPIFCKVLADRLLARRCADAAKLVIEWEAAARSTIPATPAAGNRRYNATA
ncbi:hypothetical protein QYH69_05910 [Paraburkholderia sp. SARCC-3016]|uniref:hypothetical protein n=1 Tax=Paraburkholderia sp. SARCC-3016 TaxID=3058611 RepID=UPI0028092033|nr:hypothetical protein [Paraburkholderia sp. SARCC-3016]MDQ7976778.1 hypothetical protein [Paraburkholderia sp. SARCC-3016]